MNIGLVFPQTEIGSDVGAVRAYGSAADELGYSHVLAYDHVVGADPAVHEGWTGFYDIDCTFHEPFVLFGFLAGFTSLGFATTIVILPQRQTALVAKQAAEIDLLAGGGFRLGVGLGWNAVEYEALGKDFRNRGARIEEQVRLLRALWTERSVDFAGEFEVVHGAGIAPMPKQRPIPIWFGADSAPAYRRVGRLADGWFPEMAPAAELDDARAIISQSAEEAGRSPEDIAMEGRVRWGAGGVDEVASSVDAWRSCGATHVALNTMAAGLGSVDEHLDVLAAVAGALGLRR